MEMRNAKNRGILAGACAVVSVGVVPVVCQWQCQWQWQWVGRRGGKPHIHRIFRTVTLSKMPDVFDTEEEESACGACSDEKDEGKELVLQSNDEDELMEDVMEDAMNDVEITVEVKMGKKMRKKMRTVVMAGICGGELYGDCKNCVASNGFDIYDFAPTKHKRKMEYFNDAFEAARIAFASKNSVDLKTALETISKRRLVRCSSCTSKLDHYRLKHKKKALVPIVKWANGQQCLANCTHPSCPRGFQQLDQFIPAASNQTHRPRNLFLKLLKCMDEAQTLDRSSDTCKKLMVQVQKTRRKLCETCRLIAKKTQANEDTARGECMAKWFELQALMQEMGCFFCGRSDSMTLEHRVPSEKKLDKEGNTVCLSEYPKWTTIGGPSGMQREFDLESTVPSCYNCQSMQLTHSAMQPKIETASLPDGRKNGTKAESDAYDRKWQLINRYKKQDYVNRYKLKTSGGKCEDCAFQMVDYSFPLSSIIPGQHGFPHAFQTAHKSELDWEASISKLVTSHLSFAKAKPKIDKELKRCRILCFCCALTETNSRATVPGPSLEGN
jgi:hypothetical protein